MSYVHIPVGHELYQPELIAEAALKKVRRALSHIDNLTEDV